jgi:hypothetical protein
MELTGWEGTAGTAVIPSHVRDLPVTKIASHAFDGRTDLRELRLPDSVTSIGAFCFYNCRSLKKIHMYDSVEDFYDGALRQCLSLEEITIEFREKDHYSIVKEILADNDRMLTFHLVLPDGIQLRLTFPAYFDGFKEDTMARAIHHSINGSGFSYRECISRAGVDYREYDSLFARTRLQDAHLATEIACERLCRPCELREKPRDMYREFLRENGSEALRMAVTEKREDWLRMMLEQDLPDAAARGNAAQLAAERGETGMVALLMKQRPQRSRKRLEL